MTGELRQRPGDQPLPVPGTGPSIHDLVHEDLLRLKGGAPAASDLLERKKLGLRRYGSILQAGNGRDATLDLYQELADAAVYARQRMCEVDLVSDESTVLAGIYDHLIGDLIKMRRLMAAGERDR
jgi:hypothetical protein